MAGFGAGALVTAPIATLLIQRQGVFAAFGWLGLASLLCVTGAAFWMTNPEPGWRPVGWRPEMTVALGRDNDSYTLPMALRSWQWYALWLLLFLNVTAGISIISQAAPMVQEVTGVGTALAATMVGIISIANGAGRLFWARLSDLTGRRVVFFAMFLIQATLFCLLPRIHSFPLYTGAAVCILLCYGGGFGTMPAFCADYFGSREVGSIYGLLLTAWGFGSALGPMLIAHVRQGSGRYDQALWILAGIMVAAAILPPLLRSPREARRMAENKAPLVELTEETVATK